MQRTQFQRSPCPIARSLDVLGDWWTPLIIRECLYGVHRFADLQRWLGIGRNTLTRRLNQLVEQGILERRPYQTRPMRYDYVLTEKGYDAATVLVAVMPFGERWFFEGERAPIELFDRASGKRVHPVVVDAETGEPIDPRGVVAGPGPTFPGDEAARRRRFTGYYAMLDVLDESAHTDASADAAENS